MSKIHHLVAVLFSTLALAASAQAQQPMGASAPMPGDCAKPQAKHDHGAEKGTPRSLSKAGPCKTVTVASEPAVAASASRKKPTHDHAKTHKTM